MRLLIYAVPIILALYALIDCVRNEKPMTSSLPKPLWLVVIVVVPVIGPLAWLLVSRFVDPGGARPQPTIRPNRPQPRRPRAPDDDPDFLWRLGQQGRRARREREERDGKPKPPTDEPDHEPDTGADPGADPEERAS